MDNPKRILFAKTALDGHWAGAAIVSRALRDSGFEVIMIGMTQPAEIVRAAIDEDVDLVGLSIGGRVQVAERAIELIRKVRPDMPIFAGGTVPPWAKRRLEAIGVEVYPPGSQLPEIVGAARRLTAA